MLMKRGLTTFGLIGALALASGCKMESTKAPTTPSATQPSTQPVVATAVEAPKASPATQPTAPEVATSPTTKPAVPPIAALVPPTPEVKPPAVPEKPQVSEFKPESVAGGGPLTKTGTGTLTLSGGTSTYTGSAVLSVPVPQSARLNGWYQWRGPEQNGISRETGLPDKWDPDTGENVVWTSDVGGMSSPVVFNGKIYTWSRDAEVAFGEGDTRGLTAGPKTRESLVCVDATSGKVLWKHYNNMTQTEVPFHRLGWSSPCVDPSTGRVYALGSQAWMLCLEGDTGKVVWQRQMTEEFGQISTFGGRTQAPTVDEDHAIMRPLAAMNQA